MIKKLVLTVALLLLTGLCNTASGQFVDRLKLPPLPPPPDEHITYINNDADFSFGNVLAWNLTHTSELHNIRYDVYEYLPHNWRAYVVRNKTSGELLYVTLRSLPDECFLGQKGWRFGSPVMVYAKSVDCTQFLELEEQIRNFNDIH